MSKKIITAYSLSFYFSEGSTSWFESRVGCRVPQRHERRCTIRTLIADFKLADRRYRGAGDNMSGFIKDPDAPSTSTSEHMFLVEQFGGDGFSICRRPPGATAGIDEEMARQGQILSDAAAEFLAARQGRRGR